LGTTAVVQTNPISAIMPIRRSAFPGANVRNKPNSPPWTGRRDPGWSQTCETKPNLGGLGYLGAWNAGDRTANAPNKPNFGRGGLREAGCTNKPNSSCPAGRAGLSQSEMCQTKPNLSRLGYLGGRTRDEGANAPSKPNSCPRANPEIGVPGGQIVPNEANFRRAGSPGPVRRAKQSQFSALPSAARSRGRGRLYKQSQFPGRAGWDGTLGLGNQGAVQTNPICPRPAGKTTPRLRGGRLGRRP
jgi:hypothetical protein